MTVELVPEKPKTDNFGTAGRTYPVPDTLHVGHRADPQAYTRSKDKPYKKKIEKQRARKTA
jgi:hypothetical protein